MKVDLKIYQCYFSNETKGYLDPAFIPYDNSNATDSSFYEYPIHKRIYEIHKNEDCHFGLVSWKWGIKTAVAGQNFVDFIQDNPGYDLYHCNPHGTVGCKNSFIHGEKYIHGIIDFTESVLRKMDINFDLREIEYRPEEHSYAQYWIGNLNFWKGWFEFSGKFIDIVNNDKDYSNYMYNTFHLYHGTTISHVFSFPFVYERLVSIYMIINREKLKVINYPVVPQW